MATACAKPRAGKEHQQLPGLGGGAGWGVGRGLAACGIGGNPRAPRVGAAIGAGPRGGGGGGGGGGDLSAFDFDVDGRVHLPGAVGRGGPGRWLGRQLRPLEKLAARAKASRLATISGALIAGCVAPRRKDGGVGLPLAAGQPSAGAAAGAGAEAEAGPGAGGGGTGGEGGGGGGGSGGLVGGRWSGARTPTASSAAAAAAAAAAGKGTSGLTFTQPPAPARMPW